MPPTSFTHPSLSAESLIAVLERRGFTSDPPVRCVRTALDTFEASLRAGGLVVEHRRDPKCELVVRTEGEPAAHLPLASVPSTVAELPPGPLRERLGRLAAGRALLPVLGVTSTLVTTRRRDRRGKAVAVVAVHDRLAAGAGPGGSAPSWVAEVLPVAGHADDAEAVCDRLRAAGFEAHEGDLFDTVASAVGVSLESRVRSPKVPFQPDEPASAVARRVLANLSATVSETLDGTVADLDIEFLHELRVAVRRSRSVLAEVRKVLPADLVRAGAGELKWLGQVTTLPRDLDVQVEDWATAVAGLPDPGALEAVRAELVRRRAQAHVDLARHLRSRRATAFLRDWPERLADEADDAGRPLVGAFVVARVAKVDRLLLKDGRAITAESPAEDLHELRKVAKRLRYLLECFGSAFDGEARKGFVRHLKDLQDNLGAHQDADVQQAQLAVLADDLHGKKGIDAAALLALGRLSDRLDHRRLAERADFAERFARYDGPDTRRSFERLLASVEVR